jgi:hypothetical protein
MVHVHGDLWLHKLCSGGPAVAEHSGGRDETAGPAIKNMSTREDGVSEIKDDGAGRWDKS